MLGYDSTDVIAVVGSGLTFLAAVLVLLRNRNKK